MRKTKGLPGEHRKYYAAWMRGHLSNIIGWHEAAKEKLKTKT